MSGECAHLLHNIFIFGFHRCRQVAKQLLATTHFGEQEIDIFHAIRDMSQDVKHLFL